jgi:hypothetical protein
MDVLFVIRYFVGGTTVHTIAASMPVGRRDIDGGVLAANSYSHCWEHFLV